MVHSPLEQVTSFEASRPVVSRPPIRVWRRGDPAKYPLEGDLNYSLGQMVRTLDGEMTPVSPADTPDSERAERSSSAASSYSGSSSGPDDATTAGSSCSRDMDTVGLQDADEALDKRQRAKIDPPAVEFLRQYIQQIYSQIQDSILKINIIEETVEWQSKQYISEAAGIDPSSITNDEISLFTTPEVKQRAWEIAEEQIKANQQRRFQCALHFQLDEAYVEFPAQYCEAVEEFLLHISQCIRFSPGSVLEQLNYILPTRYLSSKEEIVMAHLDPSTALKPSQQLQRPSVPALQSQFFYRDNLIKRSRFRSPYYQRKAFCERVPVRFYMFMDDKQEFDTMLREFRSSDLPEDILISYFRLRGLAGHPANKITSLILEYERAIEHSVQVVLYQCNFCKENGDPYEGHWEMNCSMYNYYKMQRQARDWYALQQPSRGDGYNSQDSYNSHVLYTTMYGATWPQSGGWQPVNYSNHPNFRPYAHYAPAHHSTRGRPYHQKSRQMKRTQSKRNSASSGRKAAKGSSS